MVSQDFPCQKHCCACPGHAAWLTCTGLPCGTSEPRSLPALSCAHLPQVTGLHGSYRTWAPLCTLRGMLPLPFNR